MNVGTGNIAPADIARKPIAIIRPLRGAMPINVRELWAYRELHYSFTWRDINVSYKQTLKGFAGASLQPLSILTWGGLLQPMLEW
jgi:hypothetical protein